jgi:hypothetical protein
MCVAAVEQMSAWRAEEGAQPAVSLRWLHAATSRSLHLTDAALAHLT